MKVDIAHKEKAVVVGDCMFYFALQMTPLYFIIIFTHLSLIF